MAIGAKLKNYLNNEESNNIFWLYVTKMYMPKYRHNMVSSGNITAEEHKHLKMAETYLGKFTDSILSRVNQKTIKNFSSKFADHEIRVMDAKTLHKMRGQWADEIQAVHLKREEFEDFCEQIMEVKCNGCEINPEDCNLYDLLEENFVPVYDACINCKYAYKRRKK